MDVDEAGFIIGEALGGKSEVVRNALRHQSDEAIEEFYRAWRLLGLSLSVEFVRRSILEEATAIAAQLGLRNYLGQPITPKEE